jgi:Sec-independent protein translocase protein TatA
MNIFGMGTAELLVIVLIMLIVAGPKRMITWAYIAGQYLAKLRDMWGQMVELLQKEFDDAGVDVKVPKDLPTRGNINRAARDAMKPLSEPFEQATKEYDREVKELQESMNIEKAKASTKSLIQPANGSVARSKRKAPNLPDKPEQPETPAESPANDATGDNTPPDEPKAASGFGTWSTPPSEDEE